MTSLRNDFRKARSHAAYCVWCDTTSWAEALDAARTMLRGMAAGDEPRWVESEGFGSRVHFLAHCETIRPLANLKMELGL